MNTKKILALLLAVLMLASLTLTACGNNATVEEEEPVAKNEVATEEEAEVEEEEEEEFTRFEDQREVTIVMQQWGDFVGVKEVEEEVTKITEELINVKVKLIQINMSNYASQLGLMLAAQDDMDLMMCTPAGAANFTTLQSNNQLYDVAELLPVYGKEILALMARPELNYLSATTFEGAVLSIPAYRMYTTSEWLFFRRDILEALNLTEQAKACDSWTDLEAILATVHAAMDTLPEELQVTTLMGCQGTGTVTSMMGTNWASDDKAGNTANDYFGVNYLCADPETDTVFCNYTSEATLEHCRRLYQFSEKGYIYKDAATDTVTSENQMAAGTSFCYFSNGELGCEQEKSKTVGRDLLAVKWSTFPVSTSYCQSWGWAVPYCAQDPEAAIAVLNLMYSNKEIENLLVWGIEGRDYALNEIGEAYRLTDTLQYQSIEFFYGNQLNAHPSVGQGADMRELQKADNDSGELSRYFGLVVDNTAVTNEMVACENVISQYFGQIASGAIDPDTVWDEFCQAMEDAGIQKIIDLYQEGVNNFVAGK